MLIQVCKKDQYGYGSIDSSRENANIKDSFDDIKKVVTERNFSNALVEEYQLISWESFFVVFTDEDDNIVEDVYFAGFSGLGQIKIYVDGDRPEVLIVSSMKETPYKAKFVIGVKNGEYVYAQTQYKRSIDDFGDTAITTKDCYFLNILN